MQEIITRSPFLNCETPFPTSSITPMPSCPRILPGIHVGTSPFRMCRSVPQIVVFTILTTASLCCSSFGLGRSSTAIDLGPWYTSAFIVLFYYSPCLFLSSEERLVDSLIEIRTCLRRLVSRQSSPNTEDRHPARFNLAGRLGSCWVYPFVTRKGAGRVLSKEVLTPD